MQSRIRPNRKSNGYSLCFSRPAKQWWAPAGASTFYLIMSTNKPVVSHTDQHKNQDCAHSRDTDPTNQLPVWAMWCFRTAWGQEAGADLAQVSILLTYSRRQRQQVSTKLHSLKPHVYNVITSEPHFITRHIRTPGPGRPCEWVKKHQSKMRLAGPGARPSAHGTHMPPNIPSSHVSLLFMAGNTNTYTFICIESKIDVWYPIERNTVNKI